MPIKTKTNKKTIKKEIKGAKVEEIAVIPEKIEEVKVVRKTRPKVKKITKSKVKKIVPQDDLLPVPKPIERPKPWTMSFNRILLIAVVVVVALILVIWNGQKMLQLDKHKVKNNIKDNPIVKVEPKDQTYQNPLLGFKFTYNSDWTLQDITNNTQTEGSNDQVSLYLNNIKNDGGTVAISSFNALANINPLDGLLPLEQDEVDLAGQKALFIKAKHLDNDSLATIYLFYRGDRGWSIITNYPQPNSLSSILQSFSFDNTPTADQRVISGKVTYDKKLDGYVIDDQFLGNDIWRYGYYLDSNVEVSGVDSQDSEGQPVFSVWSIKGNDSAESIRDIFAPTDPTNLELYANDDIGFSFNYFKNWIVKPAAAGSDLINLEVRDKSNKLLAIIKANNKTLDEALTQIYAVYQVLSIKTQVIDGAYWLRIGWWNEGKNGTSYFWLLAQNGNVFQIQGDPDIFHSLSFSSK